MSYTYKNKKTGKIIKTEKPLIGKKKEDFVLIGWIKNMMIKANNIIKK